MATASTVWDAVVEEGRQERIWIQEMAPAFEAFERQHKTFTHDEIDRRLALITYIGGVVKPQPRYQFSRRILDQKKRDLTEMMPWAITLVDWAASGAERGEARRFLMEAGRWLESWDERQDGSTQYHIVSHVAVLMRMALETAQRGQGGDDDAL